MGNYPGREEIDTEPDSKVTHFAELSTCDMVIETIIEDLEAKKEVFTQLDQVCPSHVILASNTSTLSLTELASSTKYPERVIGMHFIHPVSKVDLVEIIRGLKLPIIRLRKRSALLKKFRIKRHHGI